MRYKVWLTAIFICCSMGSACALSPAEEAKESALPLQQDTLEMEPDFSYEFKPQKPHIFVDASGYRKGDKKVAFFYGNDLSTTFEIRHRDTQEVLYTGKLSEAAPKDGKTLYTGVFTAFSNEGNYYIHHKELGDSYDFVIKDDLYNQKYKELENRLLKEKYEDTGTQAYLLANYMFIREMEPEKWINESYIRAKMEHLLESQDALSGAFYKEIGNVATEAVKNPAQENVTDKKEGTVSLSATAQMAGVLAQYVYLYRDSEDAFFINKCLMASQKAYRYVEKYRGNTDTDAWYYAATQLYRTTGQFKYRNAIAEYDTLPMESRSSTEQGYTILADFAYLSTQRGTDYNRCAVLLEGYLDKAQNISVNSSRENFYVLEEIESMTDKEILEDMFIMGVINYILSGQEYAGVQKNYIHYLSGVNMELGDYLNDTILVREDNGGIDVANAVKMLVVYGNICD